MHGDARRGRRGTHRRVEDGAVAKRTAGQAGRFRQQLDVGVIAGRRRRGRGHRHEVGRFAVGRQVNHQIRPRPRGHPPGGWREVQPDVRRGVVEVVDPHRHGHRATRRRSQLGDGRDVDAERLDQRRRGPLQVGYERDDSVRTVIVAVRVEVPHEVEPVLGDRALGCKPGKDIHVVPAHRMGADRAAGHERRIERPWIGAGSLWAGDDQELAA